MSRIPISCGVLAITADNYLDLFDGLLYTLLRARWSMFFNTLSLLVERAVYTTIG